MEDRYSAIRAAIGTAGPEDVILLAGRGHVDWVHHAAEDGGMLTGWLDDRVEVRRPGGRGGAGRGWGRGRRGEAGEGRRAGGAGRGWERCLP